MYVYPYFTIYMYCIYVIFLGGFSVSLGFTIHGMGQVHSQICQFSKRILHSPQPSCKGAGIGSHRKHKLCRLLQLRSLKTEKDELCNVCM